MSTNQNRKIDNILDALERHTALTSTGRDWLIAACDPFHDEDMRLDGYPDLLTSGTVVQLVKKTIQLTVPTTGRGAVTASNNWDCSIALFPSCVNSNVVQSQVADASGNLSVAITSTGPYSTGALSINAGPQGQALWPNLATQTPVATSQQLDMSEYVKGSVRVIGMGFEVINTTSDLNKQGQVTAWRMPTLGTPTTYHAQFSLAPNVDIAFPAIINRFPPGTLADAQLLYGSRSWAAGEGAYVVSRQNDIVNPIYMPDTTNFVYTGTDVSATGSHTVYTDQAFVLTGNIQPADVHLPFDISGVHFTGLSFTTTLTVNVRWLVERIPGPSETDLVVLATPSAPFDPLALELYCKCLRSMPPGVMLRENPLGEWFRNALSKVAEYAPVVLGKISQLAPLVGAGLSGVLPGAGAIGQMVGTAAGVGSQIFAHTPLMGSSQSNNRKDLIVEKTPKVARLIPQMRKVVISASKKKNKKRKRQNLIN